MGRRDDLIALLRERSVVRGQFQLASGRTSSYYVDARRTTMSAAGLALVGSLGLESLREAGWVARAVGGLTLGADPVAYAIALVSRRAPPSLDAFTVRKAAKDHGTARRIEGCFEPGLPVVVVEDVLTTGSSVLEAVAAVREAGGDVLGVLAVVDRQEGGRDAIERGAIAVRTIVTAQDLGLVPDGDGTSGD